METAIILVAENRWSLPVAGTSKKGDWVAYISQGLQGWPNSDHRDALPKHVLPLVFVVVSHLVDR